MTPPFPFFVGRGRSGTTLVRAIFDSNSQMAVPNESWFVASMALNRKRYEAGGGFEVQTYLTDLFERRGFLSWGLDLDHFRSYLQSLAPPSLPEAIRATYAYYAASKGKPRFGDKTPVYVLAISPIARLLPESKFVHVVRDGRDSALSYKEVPWGPRSIDEAAFRWRRAVNKAREAGRELGSERYLELRYEALVADPSVVVSTVCEFIEVPFEENMLNYFERADQVTALMRHPQTRAGIYKPISSGMRDWRTQMSAADVRHFEAIAGSALTDYGYARSARPVSFAVWALAWAKVFRVLVGDRLRKFFRQPADPGLG
jgi:hypothetical protein